MEKEEGYKFKQVIIRMKYNTFLRLKKSFPTEKNESAAEYFERIAECLEDMEEFWGGKLK